MEDAKEPREGGARRKRAKDMNDESKSATRLRDEPLHTGGRSKQDRALNSLLAGIGTPEPAPFQPDPFQLEALAALEYEDVLVTAPTGSGKTWIAREEIRRLISGDKRAWYTTPLKALTNSKYQEFAEEFGAENVGILTGDRKENADAPLIVGTTEIYRNQLFDSLRNGTDI
ncbi:MAG TPA: DEAD/DEAH box helicase, partial [Pyrinomonadaceae bacterium]|nr:DEAD/DEAH box helicase [Pyrinomonadaceae bacterium]